MIEPTIQMQHSRSGKSVWLVLIMPQPKGIPKKVRFGQSYGLTKAFINRTIYSNYITFTVTKPHKDVHKDETKLS